MTKKSKPDDTISDADYYRANGMVGMGLENISPEDLIEPETDETYEDEALWQTEYDMRLPPTIRIGIADQYSFKVAASYLEPHGTEAVERLRQTMQFFPSRKSHLPNIKLKEFRDTCDAFSESALALKNEASHLWSLLVHTPSPKTSFDGHEFYREIFYATYSLKEMSEKAQELKEAIEKQSSKNYVVTQKPVKDFVERCTQIWMDVGLKVSQYKESDFANYLIHAYQAAFNEEIQSPSGHLEIADKLYQKNKGITDPK